VASHRFLRVSAISALECARALAQQPQHEKKWNQRRHEEDEAAAAMNETMNHLWTYVHTEKSDDYDANPFAFCAEMMSRARASFDEVGISNVSFRPGRK
jgi:hypothetical protein